jgi:UDP-N-acetyl-D-galactosamine dehydrogenase
MNDSMGEYVASEVIKRMIKEGIRIKGAGILVLGITFKENCPDIRNSKAVDVIRALEGYGTDVTVYDPLANREEVKREYGLDIETGMPEGRFDAAVIAVAHKEFETMKFNGGIVYDLKNGLS